jgi:hypothetical protein
MSRLQIEKGSISVRQIAVVIGLGIALVWVLFDNDAPSETSETTIVSGAIDQTLGPPAGRLRGSANRGSLRSAKERHNVIAELSNADFERIVNANPFVTHRDDLLNDVVSPAEDTDSIGRVEKVPVPELTSEQQALAELSQSSMQLYYSSSRGSTAAIVDGRVLHAGDVVEGLATVESLSVEGVQIRWSLPTTKP